jgi:hypothetical protein
MSMSANAAQIPMANIGWEPTSPLGALAQWNDVQKGGLQNTGLQLQNQQAQLMLGLRGQLASRIGLGPNGQPIQGGGMPPGAMQASPGMVGPGGGGGAGGQPAGVPGIGDGSWAPQLVSPYATTSPYGVPMPQAQMISAVMSNDPMKAITDSYNMGRQRVTQLLTQAGDVNDPDPAKGAQAGAMIKAAAGQLYTEGWIDPNAYQTLMSNPAKASAFIAGTASPDAHMGMVERLGVKGLRQDSNGQVVYDPNAAAGLATAAGQVAGSEARAKVAPAIAEAAGKAPYGPLQPIQVPVTDKNGAPVLGSDGQPTYETRYVHPGIDTPAGPAGAAGAGGAGGPGAGDQPGITPTKVFNALVGTEASGANAVSGKGASGKAQIVQGTFDQYKLPGESYSNEDDRVAAARRYVDDMWKKYPGDTARIATGYFSGVGNIAPTGKTPWINENANDGNMSVPQYVDRFNGKLGLGPTKVAANMTGAPVATDAGGAAPAAAPAPQSGVGGLSGPPAPTPQQAADIEQKKTVALASANSNIKQVQDYQDDMVAKAQTAQRMNNLISQARQETAGWTQGTYADHKMAALKVWDTLRNNVNEVLGKKVFGDPDPSIGNWEAFNKDMLANVNAVVREVSPRAAVQEYQTIQKAQPQDTTSPQGTQMLFDQMQGIGDWVQAKSDAAGRLDKPTSSTNGFESTWNNTVTPTAFIAHRMSVPDFTAFRSRLSQTQEGRDLLGRIVTQMKFLDEHGLFNANNTN